MPFCVAQASLKNEKIAEGTSLEFFLDFTPVSSYILHPALFLQRSRLPKTYLINVFGGKILKKLQTCIHVY